MATPNVQLGTLVATGRPVEIPVKLFERHVWIQGMTGSWKTIESTEIVSQLMRLDPDAAFVMPDLGGDQYAFNRLRDTARQLGKPFQFMSVNPDDDWDSLDPMAAITPIRDLSVATSFLQAVFGGDHGEGYGPGYYGRASYVSILRTLTSFVAEGVHSFTLHDFAHRFAGKKGKLSDQSEAQLAAEMLLSYEQVQPSGWGHKRIDVPEAIERGQVTYGFLPTLMHPGARMLATALVFSYVLEAMRRHHAGLQVIHIYICIDEFPSVAGSKQWADLLVLARKYHIRLIVLTQTSEQLKSRDRDLLPVLFDNTGIKIWLTPISIDDMDTLRSLSKDVLKQRGATQGYRSGTSSVSMQEVYEPRLEANEIRDAAYTAGEGFLIANAFEGHVEPQRFRFTPGIPRDEYERLTRTALPKRERPAVKKNSNEIEPDRDARLSALKAMLSAKKHQLIWEDAP